MRRLLLKTKAGDSISAEDYECYIQTYLNFADRLIELINEINFAQFQFDHLTGLLNRRAFKIILEYEYNRSQRSKRHSCLAIADIDCFKKINDTYGHKNGDYVLKEIADYFRNRAKNLETTLSIQPGSL